MGLETEVKIHLLQPQLIQQRLISLGAHEAKPRVFERNLRYENAAGTLTPDGIVLRLRQDSKGRITYKEPSIKQASAGTITRTELETDIGDIDVMDAILQKLGFHIHMIYEKYRTTYELDGAEIVLDEMPYGDFIEIEGDADAIEGIVQKLDLSAAPRMLVSYVALFEIIKLKLGLDFRDLSFENFQGIAIPSELLR